MNMRCKRPGTWLLVLLFCLLGNALQAASGVDNYRLGAGDKIRIQVYGEKDLSIETLVDDSGTISYPFLGEIRVEGSTLREVEQRITEGLKGDYLVNPEVTVSIVEYRPFYVNGWVKQPGSFPFQPGMTVRKAISLAGGFAERANKRALTVVHGDDPSGEPQQVRLDDQLQPGDVLSVGRSFF
jgi:Periplasmic protein involved in polysaccharide export